MLGVTNPNPYDVLVDRLEFDVFINGSDVGDTVHEEKLTVNPGARELLTLKLTTSPAQVGAGLAVVALKGKVQYRLKGYAVV